MKQTIIVWLLVALGLTIGMLVEVCASEPLYGNLQVTAAAAITGNLIPNATVTISPGDISRISDSNGKVTFSRLMPGTYTVAVSAKGYTSSEKREVRLTAGSSLEIVVTLIPVVGVKQLDAKAAGIVNKYETATQTTIMARSKPEAKDDLSSNYKGGNVSLSAEAPAPGSPDYSNVARRPNHQPEPPRVEFNYQSLPPFDMRFHDFGTNGFVDPRRDRFSTFGADIDDASYALVRRYLNDGDVPPADAVRVEEFVNHFDYGYNPPEEGKFRIFSELAASPFDPRTSYLKIGIKGREISESRRKPIALTAVIDVSGSMGWDNRFDVVKESMRLLSERLDSRDKIAIVAYGSFATLVLPSTNGDDKERISEAMNSLHPGGSTFAEAGLELGYQTANAQYTDGYNNLVILLSDGVANVGRTSPDAIMARIKQFARKGLTLSTFGYGMGNYNDVLLEKLAQEGNGSYAYIDSYDQARTLFAEHLVSTIQTLARDVKIQVEFNPSTVSSYRLIGYEKRAIPDQKFRDNRQDGGEIKAGHEVTALYELMLNRRCEDSHVATVNVRWKNLAQDEVTEVSQEVDLKGGIKSFESARPEFRLAVAASRFAETLKQTPYADGCFDRLLAIARRVSYDRANDESRELVAMIERAQALSAGYGEREED